MAPHGSAHGQPAMIWPTMSHSSPARRYCRQRGLDCQPLIGSAGGGNHDAAPAGVAALVGVGVADDGGDGAAVEERAFPTSSSAGGSPPVYVDVPELGRPLV